MKFSSLIGYFGLLIVTATAVGAPPQSPADYGRLKAKAEQFYAEHSYAKARELYEQADAMELPASDSRWVDFRIADTLWRAEVGTQTADSTTYDKAREMLEALLRDVKRVEDRDETWAL